MLGRGIFHNKTRYSEKTTILLISRFNLFHFNFDFFHILFYTVYRFIIHSFTSLYDEQQTFGADLIRVRIRPVITLKLYARILQRNFAWKWIQPFQLQVKILNPRFRFDIIASMVLRHLFSRVSMLELMTIFCILPVTLLNTIFAMSDFNIKIMSGLDSRIVSITQNSGFADQSGFSNFRSNSLKIFIGSLSLIPEHLELF